MTVCVHMRQAPVLSDRHGLSQLHLQAAFKRKNQACYWPWDFLPEQETSAQQPRLTRLCRGSPRKWVDLTDTLAPGRFEEFLGQS